MTKQQKDFVSYLTNKYDASDIEGIEKEIKKTIRNNPGKISLVPTEFRTLNVCKYLIKQTPFGFDGVKKYIPQQIREKIMGV